MLQNPSISGRDVALRWGFVNVGRFGRYFRDAYGISPTMVGRDLVHRK
ncbi:TPA: hypothetical protein ACRNML_001269 [Pseudomonas aeruginosa]